MGIGRMFLTGPHPGGAVAQLEEYLNGIQGVGSSNLLSSTNPTNNLALFRFLITHFKTLRGHELLISPLPPKFQSVNTRPSPRVISLCQFLCQFRCPTAERSAEDRA